MKLLAAIFDLDGTIIDSMGAWGEAFVNVFAALGVKPETSHPEIMGVSVKDNWKNLVVKYNIKNGKTLEELEVLTYNEFEKMIPEIVLRDGVLELITNLKDSGTEIALATSSSWEVAEKILRNLKIEYLFDNLTTGEEVLSQKPDPEIFVKAAEKLSLEPNVCLVFEDSPAGVKAAKDAGMKVIVIDPTGENADVNDADLIIGSFSEVTPKAIDSL